MIKWFLGIILILLTTVAVLFVNNKSLRTENTRLANNNRVLTADVDTFRTRLGQSVAQVESLNLTLEEFKQQNSSLAEHAQMLELKLRRINSYSINAMQSSVQFTVPLQTSLELPNNASVKQFVWNDTWNRVEGEVSPDSIKCSVKHIDTLDQIIYRVPKKFWFIKYGTKAIKQVVTLRDTNSKIEYSRYIVLKRER